MSVMYDNDILTDMAQQLLAAASKEESLVDKELLRTAENLITTHHFYVQLLFISLIIDRMRGIKSYFTALDDALEDLVEEDMAEMEPKDKVRLIQSVTAAVKTQLEIVSNITASKEASSSLLASLKESFQVPDIAEHKDTGILEEISEMTPAQRQRVLKGTIQALRILAKEEKEV